MIANFNQQTFNRVRVGHVTVKMHDGRVFNSGFPLATWKWLQSKPRDWLSIDLWDDDFQQSYGWDCW